MIKLTLLLWQLLLLAPLVLGADKQCAIDDLASDGGCDANEMCSVVESVPRCICLPDFARDPNASDSSCRHVEPHSMQNSSSASSVIKEKKVDEGGGTVAAVMIPLMLIVLVICIVYVGYRFKVVNWVRMKMSQRSTNYDEFMIGQDLDDDDPPLR